MATLTPPTLVSVDGFLDVVRNGSGVSQVALYGRAGAGDPVRDLVRRYPDPLHVAQYVRDRAVGRVETVVTLDQP